jgi:hypothetical protein
MSLGLSGRPESTVRGWDAPKAPIEVVVTRIDLSFENILVLALKIGIVWAVLGVIGALIFRATT